ncbi:MAG: hypothetical protein HS118_08195 [Bacteroidia bacterium]|nr:hypothetical protein [Bacteroidia bacterium]
MKSNFAHIGLARLCGWFGITRQAYYQNNWEGISTTLEEDLIIQRVKEIRKTIAEWEHESCMNCCNHLYWSIK